MTQMLDNEIKIKMVTNRKQQLWRDLIGYFQNHKYKKDGWGASKYQLTAYGFFGVEGIRQIYYLVLAWRKGFCKKMLADVDDWMEKFTSVREEIVQWTLN